MSKYYKMPNIDLSKCNLNPEELALAQGIINSKTGELRASKPPVPRKTAYSEEPRDGYVHRQYDYPDPQGANAGRTAYIWRMVAFMVSPVSQHQCMPVLAECDLPGNFEQSREEAKRLDKIVDKIVDSIPASQWHGVRRWGHALGYGG